MGDGASQWLRAGDRAGALLDAEAGAHQRRDPVPEGHEAGLPVGLSYATMDKANFFSRS